MWTDCASANVPADMEMAWHVCYILAVQRDEALTRLRAHETELRDLGVESLYLFGSTARGENRDDSDVDLFFDYARGRFGLFDLMDVTARASAILGATADVTSRDGLHDLLRPQIEETAIQVF